MRCLLYTSLNGMFRVKDEYSVPMDQKLDVEAFADSILKSNIDEEHDFAWLKEHAVYDHPPVSYTHLDVYKRQGCSAGELLFSQFKRSATNNCGKFQLK